MAIATLDDIIKATTVNSLAQRLDFSKLSLSAGVAYVGVSLWQAPGIPGAGSVPTVGKANGRATDKSTSGAMLYNNPTAPATMSLISWQVASVNGGITAPEQVFLLDKMADVLLAHNEATGAVTGCTATARLGSTSGDGDGCQIWAEVVTALGAGSNTYTITYTNQNGNSATTPQFSTVASTTQSLSANGGLFIPLAAGDTGVRSIDSVTLVSGSQGTGTILYCLVKQVSQVAIMNNNLGVSRDFVNNLPACPQVVDGTCFMLIHLGGTGTNPLHGMIRLVEN